MLTMPMIFSLRFMMSGLKCVVKDIVGRVIVAANGLVDLTNSQVQRMHRLFLFFFRFDLRLPFEAKMTSQV